LGWDPRKKLKTYRKSIYLDWDPQKKPKNLKENYICRLGSTETTKKPEGKLYVWVGIHRKNKKPKKH